MRQKMAMNNFWAAVFVLLALLAALAFLAADSKGAVVPAPFRFSTFSTVDSIRYKHFEDLDSIGTGALVPLTHSKGGDSIHWEFSINIEDTKYNKFDLYVYYHGETKPISTDVPIEFYPRVNMPQLIAKMDTLNALADSAWWSSGDFTGAFSFQVLTADVDTLFFGVLTDTLWGRVYFHPGGSPGDPPDSTRTFPYSDR